ncbi:hypothetical protein [Gordonia westfalica]|nr:hypothetical protein [Gordonia westfalica]
MSEAFGLRDGGELVAVMCMKWRTKTEVELVRFATSVIVRGGHSRLLKHAVAAMQPQRVVTFADHAVSDGGLYEQCGFIKDGELRPDYTYYFSCGERVHKVPVPPEAVPQRPKPVVGRVVDRAAGRGGEQDPADLGLRKDPLTY